MGGDKELLVEPVTPFEEQMAQEIALLKRQLTAINDIINGSGGIYPSVDEE